MGNLAADILRSFTSYSTNTRQTGLILSSYTQKLLDPALSQVPTLYWSAVAKDTESGTPSKKIIWIEGGEEHFSGERDFYSQKGSNV